MIIDLSTGETSVSVRQINTKSLGDHSYIVVVGEEAAAIDIQRDLGRFESVLEGVKATLVAVFETHIHNDYVSGGKRLAEAHGATYVLPANTGATYEHTPLPDGEFISVGGWTIRAMHTPGHTYNHTSYVLESPGGPVAIFTGGSMLVGAVGRSDLLGPDHTEQLLFDQFASANRIADTLPDPSIIAPTHGAGSFCSASEVADTTSTVEREKMQNPALLAPSAENFAASQVLGYKQYPAYYKHMAPSNLLPLGAPPEGELSTLKSLSDTSGATIVDVRPFLEYAGGHIPGSICVPASADDAVYMGWTLEWNSPIVLVGSEADVAEVRVHLARIGWDQIVGRIDPDMLDQFADGPLATTPYISFADLDGSDVNILDVRDPLEHLAGVIPGADLVHLADMAKDPLRYAKDEVTVHCQGGYRASIAAGFLEAQGSKVTVVYDSFNNYTGPLTTPAS